MRKVIIDCDPGIDDAFLLFLADRSEDVEVLGIVAVAGNVPGEQTYENARRISSILRHPAPVYRGSQKPLSGEQITAGLIHGGTGLGDAFFPAAKMPEEELDGIEAMISILNAEKEPIDLIAVGPLTDLALLLRRDDCPKEKIRQISLMGGGIKGGNWTVCAEFNIFADVEAADFVFRSGIPILMAGLDVTEKASISKREIDEIGNRDESLASILDALSRTRRKHYEEAFGESAYCPNDTVSLLALTNPDLFDIQEMHVEVVTDPGMARGMTVADRRAFGALAPNVRVVMDVDLEGFRREMVRRYT